MKGIVAIVVIMQLDLCVSHLNEKQVKLWWS